MDADNTTGELTLEQHVARAQGTRQRLTDELRDLVAEEQAIYDDLKTQADAAKSRRDGYQRALDHIQGASKVAAVKPAKRSKGDDWRPSDEKVDIVWQAFREAWRQNPKPLTHTALGKQLPMGPDTLRKAFDVLRERELIRVAGTARGGGKLWALMPASEDERLTVAA
jgi:hypothetical protein